MSEREPLGSPSPEQARQFALMLSSGAPSHEAIRYFLPEDAREIISSSSIAAITDKWMRSKLVQKEIVILQGGEWEDLSIGEKLQLAIDKTYVEMAYFLYTRNYVDLDGPSKAKADTCRVALEAKLAGTAGKLNAVEQFWLDVQSGKVKLATPAQA